MSGRFIEEFFIITFMNKFIAIVLLICTTAFANEDGVVPEVDRKRQIDPALILGEVFLRLQARQI